jgi:hypothetical protein
MAPGWGGAGATRVQQLGMHLLGHIVNLARGFSTHMAQSTPSQLQLSLLPLSCIEVELAMLLTACLNTTCPHVQLTKGVVYKWTPSPLVQTLHANTAVTHQPALSVRVQALLPDAWPDMLRTLAGFLCPFRAMMQQRQQEAMAAAAVAAAAAGAGAAPGGGNADMAAPLRTPRAAGQVASSPQAAGPPGPPRSFSRWGGGYGVIRAAG